jgi:hypothetical protein
MKIYLYLIVLFFFHVLIGSSQDLKNKLEDFTFYGKYDEGIHWVQNQFSKYSKAEKAYLLLNKGNYFKLKGDLEQAIIEWKKSNDLRTNMFSKKNYHHAWNYALLSNYHFEKIEGSLAKKYADSCYILIQHLTLQQQKEIEIYKIWNILAQSYKLNIENTVKPEDKIKRYNFVRGFYSKSVKFIQENNLPHFYLAKTYHLIGNSYVDNIHHSKQLNSSDLKILYSFSNAMHYYLLADKTWKDNFGLQHHERAKTLYLMGMAYLLLTEKQIKNHLSISSFYFDESIKAFGININVFEISILNKIPNKEDAIQCLRFKNESLFKQIHKYQRKQLIFEIEKNSKQAVKLWEIAFDNFKSKNTNQLLAIYDLIPFKDVVEIERIKKNLNLKWSKDKIFEANEKLKYYDLHKLNHESKFTKISIESIQKNLGN